MKEQHTGNMAVGQAPTIVMPQLGEDLIHGEGIPALDTPLVKQELDKLAMMEEFVTVRVEPGAEEHSPLVIDLYCNGVPCFVTVGVPQRIRRKYVEIMARAKPITIRTEHETPENAPEGVPTNKIKRSTRSQYVFSVLEDKNPKGAEWLTTVLMER